MRDRRSAATGALAAVLAVTCVASAPGAGAAAAEDVTGTELGALARRAGSDPDALRELRSVRQVDGRPVDVGRALEGADGQALHARLRALATADGAPTGRPAAEAARRQARRILDGRRFRPPVTPRPFRGVLRWIGRWLRPLTEPVARAWSRVVDNTVAQLVLATLVVCVAALTSRALVRRRSAAGVRRADSERRRRPGEDPATLERAAEAAERAGQLDVAFRLRFRAGLLRLDRAGALAYRPSHTTGELVRRLRSPTFEQLAVAFDEIAYGGRPADRPDLDTAREGWPRVLEEVGRQ